jgi:hypothetical protein
MKFAIAETKKHKKVEHFTALKGLLRMSQVFEILGIFIDQYELSS